jgi:uncharacterized membrane protein YbhN (UPF0104 family)
MRDWLKKLWPVTKALLTLAILLLIGRQFARDLQRVDLSDRPIHAEWFVLSGVLYLVGLSFSAIFWLRLLERLGPRPRFWMGMRAYYLGHLGKYLPGKAWALLLRATLAQAAGVRAGMAGVTAFYEVLTTMASGTLLAAVLFWFFWPATSHGFDAGLIRSLLTLEDVDFTRLDRKILVVLSLLVFGTVGVPILPHVFNLVVRRLSVPYHEAVAEPPYIKPTALIEGLVLTAGGWLLLAASMWAVFQGIANHWTSLSWEMWGSYTAYLSLAYVLGFVIFLVPNGLGVREYFLTLFLAPDACNGEARANAVLVVILLRLVWTIAELLVAVVIYWMPGRSVRIMKDGGTATS